MAVVKLIRPNNTRVNWRQTEYEYIMVSDTGLLWHTRLGRYVKPVVQANGTQILNIYRSQLKVAKTIAKLVYETFKGRVPEGYIVYHKDNTKENNFIGNLGIMRKAEFQKMNSKMNCGRQVVVLNKDGEVMKRYPSMTEYAKKNYVGLQTLIDYRRGRTKNPHTLVQKIRFEERKKSGVINAEDQGEI